MSVGIVLIRMPLPTTDFKSIIYELMKLGLRRSALEKSPLSKQPETISDTLTGRTIKTGVYVVLDGASQLRDQLHLHQLKFAASCKAVPVPEAGAYRNDCPAPRKRPGHPCRRRENA